jgi:predicted DNA-binding transcriptional regulator AlpA
MAGTKKKPPAPSAPAHLAKAIERLRDEEVKRLVATAAPQPEPLLAGFLTQPQLLRELNQLFPINKRTFQRWEQQRSGPPRVTLGGGRTILYSRASVLAWVQANEHKLRSRGR